MAGSELRLRREWEDIDPHQKTVLSDEVGVGYTTQLLAEELGIGVFADTLYLVRMLSDYFVLARSRKRGPRKSPDFIGLDHTLTFHVLECKGTQTSLNELQNAVARGVEQKRGLTALPGAHIGESLVAGLYIPRWDSSDPATIMLSDPIWEEMLALLQAVPPEQLLVATVALGIAKHFALMGLYTYANFLSSSEVFSHGARLPRLTDAEQGVVFEQDDLYASHEVAYVMPPMPESGRAARDRHSLARRVRFNMLYDRERLQELGQARDLSDWLLNQAYSLKAASWDSKRDDTTVTLLTPLGFQLSLSYLS